MKDKFSNLAICAVATGIIYLIWLAIAVRGVLGLIYFLLELGMFLLLFLFIVNHRSRRYVLSGGSYSLRGIVDVLIPTKGEPAGNGGRNSTSDQSNYLPECQALHY